MTNNSFNLIFLHSKFLKILGFYRLPPLKESRPRDSERPERNMGLGYLGGLPPLKENFVGSIGLGFILGSLGYNLAFVHLLNHIWLLTSFPIGGHRFTYVDLLNSSRRLV
jgi:hypothetical protein